MRKNIAKIIIAVVILCILLLAFCYLYANNMFPDIVYRWVESNETIKALVDKIIEHKTWDTIINNIKEDINIITPTAE